MNPKHTKTFRTILALGAALGLSACASVDTASRNTPIDAPLSSIESPAALTSPVKVVAVTVNVPRTLKVSEANRYYPSGDIVWREDPIGDRYEQVAAIVKGAMEQGVAGFEDGREVFLEVSVSRFHALTEKARYTVGGVHAIQFSYRLVDAETGAQLTESKFVKADFDALGGNAAVAAEARGVTQKYRITHHLAKVIQDELRMADGYAEQNNGVIGALNQI